MSNLCEVMAVNYFGNVGVLAAWLKGKEGIKNQFKKQ